MKGRAGLSVGGQRDDSSFEQKWARQERRERFVWVRVGFGAWCL